MNLTPGQAQVQLYHERFDAIQNAANLTELLHTENAANSDHMFGRISTPQYRALFAEAEARRAELTA